MISEFDSVEVITLLTAKSLATNMVIKDHEKNIFNEIPALQFLIDICLTYTYSEKKSPSIFVINKIYRLLSDYFDNVGRTLSEEGESDTIDDFSFIAKLQSSMSEINKEKYLMPNESLNRQKKSYRIYTIVSYL